jgi:hypothetical protein
MLRSSWLTYILTGLILAPALAFADGPAPAGAGSKIEVREGDTWTTVTVERKEGRKYFVRYDDGTEEWIGPDRLRKNGAAMPASPAPSPAATPTPEPPGAPPISLTDWSDINTNSAAQPGKATGTAISIPTTKPAQEFRTVTIHQTVQAFNNGVERIADCVGNSDIALISCGVIFQETPEVVRINLNTGLQLGSGFIKKKNQYVCSAADDGNVILTATAFGWDPPLHLWKLEGGDYRLQANYDPFGQGKMGEGLCMARLVDATHAIFSANSGETYLVDLRTNKATGRVIHTRDSRPYLDPSGKLLGVLTERGTAQVIRTSDFASVGDYPNAGSAGTLAIDPTGSSVGYSMQDGSLRIVKIADGSQIGVIPGIAAGHDARFQLIAPDKVFSNDGTVFDAKTALPIWIYKFPGTDDPPRCLSNGQLLMLNKSFGQPATAISVTLPDEDGRTAASTLSKASFDLVPGAKMHLSGDLSVFGAEQVEALRVLKDRIAQSKFKLLDDAAAPLQIVISARAGPEEQRAYKFQQDPQPKIVIIRSTIVTFAINLNNAPIFQQTFRFAAGNPLKMTREAETLQQAADEAALPKAGFVAGLNIPSYVAHGAPAGSPPALGSSEITPRGIIVSPRPVAPPQPAAAPVTPASPAPKVAPTGKPV